jgi:zeaxanthin glucosyltransferase
MSGHLNPMMALARRLQTRGEKVTFFGIPDVAPAARSAGVPFVSICEEEYPVGSFAHLYEPLSKLQGAEVLKCFMLEITPPFLKHSLKHLPQKLKDAGIEALVIDTGLPLVQILATTMNLPFVQVWNALHLDSSGATPPSQYAWPYEDTPEARERNISGIKPLWELIGPAISVADDYAKSMGLVVNWLDPRAILWEAHVAEFETSIGGRHSRCKNYPNTVSAIVPGFFPAYRAISHPTPPSCVPWTQDS